MDALELKAELRERTRRQVKHVRAEGWVPAIVYGRGLDTVAIKVDAKEMSRVIRQAGTHQLISLQVGKQKPQMTLARDIQQDVIKHDYLHVDFYAVRMDEKVVAQVPIVLIGEAPGVTELGGVLTQGLDELEIECLPSDLISTIEVNVEGLVEFNDTLSVYDLTIPDTVTILSEPESMVAKVEPPRLIEEEEEEEELEEGLEPVSVEPEVLTEARSDEEEEE